MMYKASPSGLMTKDFTLEVKSVDDEGTFEGYASVFGNVDSYGDRVMPGAFANSLSKHRKDGTKPLLLWQHNPDEPIGVWDDLAEDGKGLWGKGSLIREVRRGEEAWHLLKRKALRGISIGYREVKAEPNKGVRDLSELDLYEASLVSFPANRAARVVAVKNEALAEIAERLRKGENATTREFEEALREAGYSKRMAVAIASVGYAKAIGESPKADGDALASALDALKQAATAFRTK